ncbi:hypothetical protein N7G274_000151 [Stereocaulon virgatum]|uniref:Uncharacterized protein n=1 Tax=Stereocaulon virgatum TaxID=373712 RepID=A0ABR4ASM8_9LECA
MLDKNDHAVLIDLDSCCQEGKADIMCGTHMWTDDSYDDNYAKCENDFCGLGKIREWIEEPEPFHWNSWEDKESTSGKNSKISLTENGENTIFASEGQYPAEPHSPKVIQDHVRYL